MAHIWQRTGAHPILYTGNTTTLATVHHLPREHRTLAVSGPGGMGKTALCQRYISRYAQAYQRILWVNASSQSSLDEEMQIMARSHLNCLWCCGKAQEHW